MNHLKEKYNKEIVPSLKEKYGYKSVMETPKLEKIVVNMGVGDATTNSKLLEAAMNDLEIITGQKPVATRAKKAIAGFKVREGQAIGCKVTLRGENMYNFLDKLISITLPRVRDFRGISSKAFDGRGNYTLGLTCFLTMLAPSTITLLSFKILVIVPRVPLDLPEITTTLSPFLKFILFLQPITLL